MFPEELNKVVYRRDHRFYVQAVVMKEILPATLEIMSIFEIICVIFIAYVRLIKFTMEIGLLEWFWAWKDFVIVICIDRLVWEDPLFDTTSWTEILNELL